MRTILMVLSAGVLTLTLAGCNGKPSAVASQGQNTAYAPAQAAAAPPADPRDAPIPKVDGKPMWAANRKHTAEENARYQFTRNGGDFDAASETDYVEKAHQFVEKPPHDAQTVDRANGDRLIYDPGGNVFAVVSRDGAPRTMFKPRDGAAYWTAQKDRESQTGKRGRSDQGSTGGSDQS